VRKAKPIEYVKHPILGDEGCFIVTSHSCNSKGYPQMQCDHRKILISHLVYEEHFGFIPKGKCVIHTCKNRKCVNPKHLKLKSKSKLNRKLTLKQVEEIRKLNKLAEESSDPSKCRGSLIKIFTSAYPQVKSKTVYQIMIDKSQSVET
jgi:hypothetical protein